MNFCIYSPIVFSAWGSIPTNSRKGIFCGVLADDHPPKHHLRGKPTISIRLPGKIQVSKAQTKEP